MRISTISFRYQSAVLSSWMVAVCDGHLGHTLWRSEKRWHHSVYRVDRDEHRFTLTVARTYTGRHKPCRQQPTKHLLMTVTCPEIFHKTPSHLAYEDVSDVVGEFLQLLLSIISSFCCHIRVVWLYSPSPPPAATQIGKGRWLAVLNRTTTRERVADGEAPHDITAVLVTICW